MYFIEKTSFCSTPRSNRSGTCAVLLCIATAHLGRCVCVYVYMYVHGVCASLCVCVYGGGVVYECMCVRAYACACVVCVCLCVYARTRAACVCVYPFCVFLCCRLAKLLKKHLYGFEHFQSNCTSPVLLVLDLDLHFQGQHFWNFVILANISQMMRDRTKTLLSSSDRKFGICYPMATLQMLDIVSLTYIFKVAQFLELIKYLKNG